jgi:hypothetical protein
MQFLCTWKLHQWRLLQVPNRHFISFSHSIRFSHDIAVVSNLSNPGPIRSIAVTQDGWIFVASDKSIMAYNSTSGTIQLADSFSLDADIHHIEVVGQFLIVAVDGFVDQFPQVSVGQVNVLNLTTNQTIPLLVSSFSFFSHLKLRRDRRRFLTRIRNLFGSSSRSRWTRTFTSSRVDWRA